MQEPASISSLELKLDALTESLSLFLPEFALTATFITVLIAGLFVKSPPRRSLNPLALPALSIAGLCLTVYFLLQQWGFNRPNGYFFLDMVRLDKLAVFIKGLIILAAIGTLIINRSYSRHKEHAARSPEFFLLVLGLTLGAMVMTMATNLLMLFLSIEIVSISAYILTGFLRSAKSAEAGVKYLIFGATASAMMLFGMSLLYGLTGSLAYTDTGFILQLAEAPAQAVVVACLLTLCGLFFKLSLVPLHIWAPDVYEGGPLPAVALFSIVPKVAALVVMLRFFAVLTGAGPVSGTLPWQDIVAWGGIITLVVGNLAALYQQSARRLMAYSSIAHGGFMLAGIVAYTDTGVEGLLFYAAVYLFMNLAAFQWIAFFENTYGVSHIRDYAGLFRAEPLAAIGLLVTMIALTGLPPTAGFTAKLLLFGGLYDSYSASGDTALLTFLLTGLFATIAALFYYLKIPFFLFFRKPEGEATPGAQAPGGKYKSGLWIGTIFTLPLLIFFVKADWLSDLIRMVNYVLHIPG